MCLVELSLLTGEMIGQEALPEGLVARCLDVLRKLSQSERDLIRLIVEVVQELRDLTREDEPEVRAHETLFSECYLTGTCSALAGTSPGGRIDFRGRQNRGRTTARARTTGGIPGNSTKDRINRHALSSSLHRDA